MVFLVELVEAPLLARVRVSFSQLTIVALGMTVTRPIFLVTKSFSSLCSLSLVLTKFSFRRTTGQKHSSPNCFSVVIIQMNDLAGNILPVTQAGR